MTQEKLKNRIVLASFIIIIMTIGGGIGILTNPNKEGWYEMLEKSTLTPPGWVFGVVWPLLYLMIAISGFLLWRKRHTPQARPAIYLFILQLFLNWGWSFVFFTFHLTGLAVLWIMALLMTLFLTQRALFPLCKISTYLLIPYMAWVSFATYLSFCIWWLNP